jgi:hypothetical protein
VVVGPQLLSSSDLRIIQGGAFIVIHPVTGQLPAGEENVSDLALNCSAGLVGRLLLEMGNRSLVCTQTRGATLSVKG